MTKQLYEEALADVKKLKEVAEDNAKRALLEAVTPRIRDLIENQLLGELGVEEIEADPEDILKDEYPVVPQNTVEPVPVPAVPAAGAASSMASAISMPDAEGKVTLDLDALKADGCGDEYELSMEAANALGLLMSENKSVTFEDKLRQLDRKVNLFSGASKLVRESKGFESSLSEIVSEVENTYSYLQDNLQDSPKKSSYESILENHYSTLKQLMEQKMNKKLSTLSEADVTLKLTGMPDELDLDSIGVDLITGEEGEEEGGEEGGEDLDLGGEEEEEGGEEDLDLGLEDSEKTEEKMESLKLSDDTIVEIDEAMLRREIGRMKALRESADMPKNAEKGNGPGDVSDDFEDDDLGDPFTDVELTTESAPSHRSVMYSHPDLPAMGKMSGKVVRDDFEGTDMFYPDAKHHADLLKKYGYEPEAGLYLDGATLDEADKMDHVDELDEMSKEVDETYGEVDEMEEMDEMEHEGAHMQAVDKNSNVARPTNKRERMPEALRHRIASEMKLQLEAKKKAAKAKKLHKEQQAKEKQAKKEADKKQAKKNQAKLKEAYNFYATKFNESVARTNKLKGMLAEATRKGATLNGAPKSSAAETDLRNKLAETNLFNAKLLFTNKLLQNESLTKRQKAEVIERLDEAKNEREVKLVYESLVKTLAGTPAKITESADRGVIGSSSRPARPASATNTLNEGFEADRWARLAGIVK